MTNKEFDQLRALLKTAYPNHNLISDQYAIRMWYKMLNDLDYHIAENAVMEHISTHTFPPSIAEIRKLCVDRTTRPVLSFSEAWGKVTNAISKYGFYQPREAFAELDELTLSVVKELGWSNICNSTNQDSLRANFRIAYESKAKQIEKDRLLPDFVSQGKMDLQEKNIPQIKQETVNKVEEKTPGGRIFLPPEQVGVMIEKLKSAVHKEN